MGKIFDVEGAQFIRGGTLFPHALWRMDAHAHDYWEFIYFIRGCGRIDLPHATLRPSQYHLAIYPPGLSHAETSDPVDPEETRFFAVAVAGKPPADAHLLLPDHTGELRWLCEHIVAEDKEHGATPLAQAYTRAFLYLVERTWEARVQLEHDASYVAAQYLQTHYADPLTLDALAEAVGTSKSCLAHRFTARFGSSPMQYLRQVRLDVARRLLLTTSLPVATIAARVGFPDPLHFSRVLKMATGHAPTIYRQQANHAYPATPEVE